MPQFHSSEDLANEREILEELVSTDGWRTFVNRCHSEWQGVGYYGRMGLALKDPDSNTAKVVHRTSLEIMSMLEWPKARIQYLAKGKVE